MKPALRTLIAAILTIAAADVLAGPRDYVFRDKRVCDEERVLCFHGTMSYDLNPRLVYLRARVRTASGPGLLRIRLTGTNELGHRRITPFEVRLRGAPSEIINHKLITDHPDVSSWVVEVVEFIAESGKD